MLSTSAGSSGASTRAVNAPIHEALGYGKGLHDALSEIHKRALEGDIVTKASAAAIIGRHLNVPFAYARSFGRKDALTLLEGVFRGQQGTVTPGR